MKKNIVAIGLLSLTLFASCKKDIENQMPADENASGIRSGRGGFSEENIVPNELLVKFKKGISALGKDKALARITGKVKEHIHTKSMQRFSDEGVYLITTPLNALEALGKAKGIEVEYAEPNFIYTHEATTSDPYYTNGSLWGMYGDATTPANQYGSQAGEAWAAGHTGLASVFVGVIDEGIQFTHPELDGQIWNNPFDVADGVDNDGNGYIDDIHGWDFAGNNNTIYDGGKRGNLDDHGTHVAGTIGAENNGTGVVGVNWNITIISAKFLGSSGGTTANAIKAIDYLTDLKTRHAINMVASNNSWGGGGFSLALKEAIDCANVQNILFVAAAGNSGSNNDVTASYPSNYTSANIIAVAAINNTGALASFSSYGATTVDIGAPGVGINSTTALNTYSSYSGTSMATPHVTGGVALYAAYHPGSSAATIKSAVLSSAVPTASLSGKTVTGGRLNVSGF